MDKSKKEEFNHYMLAGHGRAVHLLKDNKEELKELVLYGCINDIAFDMQLEGCRGWFMYNLAIQYDDYNYFLSCAIDKFLTSEVNTDWHTICHLCDFINMYKDELSYSAINKKYDELYYLIMTMGFSEKANMIIESFECLAIVIIQRGNFKEALKVFGDIGAYFIERINTPDEELKLIFELIYLNARKEYGEDFLKQQLNKYSQTSKEIGRFNRVMNTADRKFENSKRPLPTAEEYIEKTANNCLNISHIVYFQRWAEKSDKLKLANAVVSENEINKKTEMLKAFTSSYNPFPLDPHYIVEYVSSKNEKLRETAINALSYIKADCVHDLAVEMLESSNSDYVLQILIYNYRDSDRELLFNRLNRLSIDPDNESGWHGVIMQILDTADKIDIPKELLMYVYEKSLCSLCRAEAFDKLKKRNLLTDGMIFECRFDANSNIREEAKRLINANRQKI